MNEGLKKIEELLKADPEFQEKLKAATVNYKGEQTGEAVFEGVVAPLAAEYGVSATYEEFVSYIKSMEKDSDSEINMEELTQIAAGSKGLGTGITLCSGFGIGGGSTGKSTCVIIGTNSDTGVCIGEGVST